MMKALRGSKLEGTQLGCHMALRYCPASRFVNILVPSHYEVRFLLKSIVHRFHMRRRFEIEARDDLRMRCYFGKGFTMSIQVVQIVFG